MTILNRFKSGLDWSPLDLPAPGDPERTPAAAGRIHLVGIGGIGMSGIAEVLLTIGYRISGSDLQDGESTRRLAELGAEIHLGHSEAHIEEDVDVVIVSSAVDDSNPEVREARHRRIPVIPRAEMLAELMRVKCGVGVAGAHGKTTTTSMVAAVLGRGGFDPTVVIGGRLKSLGGTNARLGDSRYMVAEADESDGSFLLLKPTVAVVTNIDREHMGYYHNMERLSDAYASYVNGVPFYGRAVLCTDCSLVRDLLPRLRKRTVTYGTTEDADLRAVDIELSGLTSSFSVVRAGRSLGRATVAMPGQHAVMNALAALAVGMEFGMPFEDAARALASFEGILRRFEVKGEAAGRMVIDDYGHHPTEIRATLGAARAALGRRVLAVFQPHRYSRLADLFADFAGCFEDADEVVVTDVYAAGESAIEGADAQALVAVMQRRHRGAVSYVGRQDSLGAAVARQSRPGDVVITLGAGDITRVGQEILDSLGR